MRLALAASTVLVLSALTGCDTGEAPTLGPDFDPAVGPALDLNMSAGHEKAAHTEAAPGVFILTALYETGEYDFTPAMGETPMAQDIEPAIGPGGGSSYCYEYETRSYSDSTSAGTLFGGDTTWSAYVSAYSYDNGPLGVTNNIYATITTSAPTFSTIDYIYAYGYVYVNERYVGYVTDYQTDDNSAYISGNWSLPCLDGTMDFKVYTTHYAYDYPDGDYTGTRQSLSISNTLDAVVECCPL